MDKKISIALVLMLLLCLADMPYGYYMLVRLAVMVYAGIHTLAYSSKLNFSFFFWLIITVLFQPFFKIGMEKEMWNILDVILAVVISYKALTEETAS